MENSPEGYHLSFFKPTTDRARANRNMVIWLVSIWFIAVFGFHIVLRIIEKPVPQPAFVSFENAWAQLGNNPAKEDLKDLAKSCLSVLGKIDVTPEAKSALDNAFSWSVYQLYDETEQEKLLNVIKEFETVRARITNISNEEYILLKTAISENLSSTLELSPYDVRRKIVPFGIQSEGIEMISEETRNNLPGVMKKYLIHNRSVLTDLKFLGFPFHYFYTAVFLLILFVGLCWIYCVRTDAMNKKLEIAD